MTVRAIDRGGRMEVSMIPVHDLLESHLNVADLQRSMNFFGQTLGLKLAEVFLGSAACKASRVFKSGVLRRLASSPGATRWTGNPGVEGLQA